MRKMPVFVLLQSLGLSKKKIYYSIKNPDYFISNKNKGLSKSIKRSLLKFNELTTEQVPNIE